MNRIREFSEPERALLVELLEGERTELRSVIHHTGRWSRDELIGRKDRVEQLLARLQTPMTAGVTNP